MRFVTLVGLLVVIPGLALAGERSGTFGKTSDVPWNPQGRTTIEPNGSGGYTVYKGPISQGKVEKGIGGTYTYQPRNTPNYFPSTPSKRR